MIRFIDLRGQVFPGDPDPLFTFYNTITDRFLTDVDGTQVWESFEEFEDSQAVDDEMLERCRSLCPEWVPE